MMKVEKLPVAAVNGKLAAQVMVRVIESKQARLDGAYFPDCDGVAVQEYDERVGSVPPSGDGAGHRVQAGQVGLVTLAAWTSPKD